MANASAHERGGWAERLERLGRLVPGLGTYQDREGLRETDKRVRTYLAELLANVGHDLEPTQRRLVDGRQLDRLPALDRIGRQVSTLADRVRLASYGFAGVFALHKIRERELSLLHEFDARLLEEVPRLQSSVRAVAEAAGHEDGFSEAAQAAEDVLWRFQQALDERDKLARGL
jgi:hypothetical protein